MAEKIGSIFYDLDLKDDQFNQKLRSADGHAKNFGGTMDKVAGAFVAMGVAAGLALKQTADFLLDSVNASAKYETAITSITRIGEKLGYSMDEVKGAARSLTKDGLLTVTDAAGGLNNLLRSGFSLKEATKLMENFKNTASFGKQSALSFGRAIVSATEGVKNGNSILVDNAGVTKNLSRILQEAGFAEADLMKVKEDASVRAALYNGLLEEGKVNIGDAAAFTETYAGKQEILNNQIFEAKAALGDVFKPALRDILNKLVPIVQSIKAWIEKNPQLVKAIVAAGVALMGLFVVMGLLSAAFLVFNVLGGTTLLIVAGIALALLAIGGVAAAFIAWLVHLYKTNEWFRNFVDETWQNVKAAIKEAWEKHIRPALAALKKAWDDLVKSIKAFLEEHPAVKKYLQDIAKFMGALLVMGIFGFFLGVAEAINLVADSLKVVADMIKKVSDLLTGFSREWDKIKDAFGFGDSKVAGGVVNRVDRFGTPQTPEKRTAGRRAAGGFQEKGELGLVGEKGPELFVPDSPGHILDAQRTASMLSNSGLLGLSGLLSQKLNDASGGSQVHNISISVNVDGVTAMTRPQAKEFGSFLVDAVNDDLRKRGASLIGDGFVKSSS